jgi:hypothetical protein
MRLRVEDLLRVKGEARGILETEDELPAVLHDTAALNRKPNGLPPRRVLISSPAWRR